jgi:hypothetical protein
MSERRLAKVAGSLSPKEAALVWLREARDAGSLRAYVDSLQHAPDTSYPLIRLGDQMEASVRASMRGKPDSEVWHAVRMAVRDAGFLYYLVSNLNFRAADHRREYWLHIALVSALLGHAIWSESQARLEVARRQALEAASTAYTQQAVAEALAERYFEGLSPWFPDVEADVRRQVMEIEQVVEILNEGLLIPPSSPPKRGKRREALLPPLVEPLDLEQVRRDVQAQVTAEVALVVDLAKAAALRLIGEREASYVLVERHVWPST